MRSPAATDVSGEFSCPLELVSLLVPIALAFRLLGDAQPPRCCLVPSALENKAAPQPFSRLSASRQLPFHQSHFCTNYCASFYYSFFVTATHSLTLHRQGLPLPDVPHLWALLLITQKEKHQLVMTQEPWIPLGSLRALGTPFRW